MEYIHMYSYTRIHLGRFLFVCTRRLKFVRTIVKDFILVRFDKYDIGVT